MADYHFHVERIKRSAGKSVVAAAAYRAGEMLKDDYYNMTHDYSKKAVVKSGIFLPAHAPPRLQNRETLWNEVEKIEKHPAAQLAYSFDFSLQNEFTMEENIELAQRFIREQFVARGMICDYAIHDPHRDGEIPNPHVHVLCPIRPLTDRGEWGNKRRRAYALDKDGNRIRDDNGDYVFSGEYVTDWDRPETLEQWRQAWADMCNQKFQEKHLPQKIDHRSFVRQGVEQIPTIHEGPAVREMEKRGIRTRVGDFNRWVKQTRRRIKTLLEKLVAVTEALADIRREAQELKEEESKEPLIFDLVSEYFHDRNLGVYSQKARKRNLDDFNKAGNYITAHQLRTVNDLEQRVHALQSKTEAYKKRTDTYAARRRELQNNISLARLYMENKPIYDKLITIKFKRSREKYKIENEHSLDTFQMAKRKLASHFNGEGKLPITKWEKELDEIDQEIETHSGGEEYQTIKAELDLLLKIQYYAKRAFKDGELTPEQKLQKQVEAMNRRKNHSR
jgi:Tfp pilus assembly protein PilP